MSIKAAVSRVENHASQLARFLPEMQKIIDKSEGPGYLLKYAGILGYEIPWGTHDNFQHVNNVQYLRWFEDARVHEFNLWSQADPNFDGAQFMSGRGINPIMRSSNIAWRRALRFPDTITVIHRMVPLTKPDRFDLEGIVFSHTLKEVAARIRENIVVVDNGDTGNKTVKCNIPENFRNLHEILMQEQIAAGYVAK